MIQQKSIFGKQLFLIFKIWLIYFLCAKLVLNFPHWKMSTIALFNYDLFFLVTLLALTVFFNERYNRFVFLNLAVFSFLYFSGLFVIFLGEKYSLGNNVLQYYVWAYRKISISIITCITVIYIPIDYLFLNKKTTYKYLLTFLITLPISFVYYRNFFLIYKYLFIGDNYYQIFSGLVGMNFLAIFFIILYGYLLFHRDRPIAGHVNLIVFSLLLFLSIDSLDNFLIYSRFSLPLFSQLSLFFNLILFILILIHNLYYLNTEFSKFYEEIRFRNKTLHLKLLRKTTIIEKYAFWLQHCFRSPSSRFFFIVLMMISIFFFLYFYPFGYTKLNFLILMMLMIILVFYLKILIKRRNRILLFKQKEQIN